MCSSSTPFSEPAVTIRQNKSDLLSSNMYLLSAAGHGIVIDPCTDLSPWDPGLIYDWIILTHEHYDHVSGVDLWRERTGARVLCSCACGENLRDDRKNLSRYFESFCEMQTWMPYAGGRTYEPFTSHADEVFDEELVLEWQGHRLFLFETPGHSSGSICILLDGASLFSGDSLIPGREPALRFPGGSKQQWREITLPRLQALPTDVLVYPGHLEPCPLSDCIPAE